MTKQQNSKKQPAATKQPASKKQTVAPKQGSSESKEKWVAGYESMLGRVKEMWDEWQKDAAPKIKEEFSQAKQGLSHAKQEAMPKLKEYLAKAKGKSVDLGELSEDEANKVASYLQRDMQDAAKYMSGAKKLFKDSINFDFKTIEKRVLTLFSSVADRTTVELQSFREKIKRNERYKAGEITGIGSLKCSGCGQVVHFHKISHIPPCPKCHKSDYVRLTGDDGVEPKAEELQQAVDVDVAKKKQQDQQDQAKD